MFVANVFGSYITREKLSFNFPLVFYDKATESYLGYEAYQDLR